MTGADHTPDASTPAPRPVSPLRRLLQRGGRHPLFLLAAAGNLLRHRSRSVATLACLLAVATPLLLAAAVHEALVELARQQVEQGPDLLVSGDTFGRGGTVPLAVADEIAALPGVLRVQPRVVSRVQLEGRTVTLLATDGPPFQAGNLLAEGRLIDPTRTNVDEAVVGSALAAVFEAYPGTGIALEASRIRLLTVVGRFSPFAPPATAYLIWTRFAAAGLLHDRPGEATELLVYTRPGYAQQVIETVSANHRDLRLQSRPLITGYLDRGYSLRTGSFALLWLLLLAAVVPVLAVTSGFGLRERSREVALLRALGWHLGEILEVSLLEDLLLASLATVGAGIGAWIWARLLHGAGIAGLLLPGAGLTPEVPLPTIFLPVPLLLVWVVAVALTLVGALIATWRAAAATPATVLR